MRQIADITLIEHSTAGNPPKTFTRQTVDIRRQDISTHMGVDGKLTPARHPSTVDWFGGKAADLKHITDVEIVDENGTTLLKMAIRTNFTPLDILGGVRFQVM